MKEEIKYFRKQNGNIVYSPKELVQALHTKIDRGFDKIEKNFEKVDGQLREVSKVFADKKMVIGMFSFLVMLIGALAGYVFYG